MSEITETKCKHHDGNEPLCALNGGECCDPKYSACTAFEPFTEIIKAPRTFLLATGVPLVDMPDFEKENWLVCANQLCRRCVIIADEGTVKAFSTEGKEIVSIESLLDLLRVLPDGIVLDGGIMLQNPDGTSLKEDSDWEQIVEGNDQIDHFVYNVIDCLSTAEFYGTEESPILSERMERIAEVAEVLLASGGTGHHHLYYAPQLKADAGTVDVLRAGMESAGWRGLALRKDVPYTRGITSDILKISVHKK